MNLKSYSLLVNKVDLKLPFGNCRFLIDYLMQFILTLLKSSPSILSVIRVQYVYVICEVLFLFFVYEFNSFGNHNVGSLNPPSLQSSGVT